MSATELRERTLFLKNRATESGFFYCGVSKAEFLEDSAPQLEKWLRKGMHGGMDYMERNFDKRLDPRLLVEGAKSVISLAFNYFPTQQIHHNEGLQVSKYAYGEDYHLVLKDKLYVIVEQLTQTYGNFNYRVFVDSAPVLEKAWAARSGVGWQGKHTNVISREVGSFFFLAEIICDLELEYDGPMPDYCGTCTRCIDACPTEAIVEPYVVDASRCISYLTIELKEQIPSTFAGKMENWIFGCDICQDVCPWNRFAKVHHEPRFEPNRDLLSLNTSDWQELTEEVFKTIAQRSPLKRAKIKGLQRNVKFVSMQPPKTL